MADGVKLDSHKAQIFDAPLHLTTVLIVIAVRTQASEAEESAGVFRAQLRDLIVSLARFLRSRIGLYDSGIDIVLIHAPHHLFFSAYKAENAALAQVSVSIDYC